VDRDQQPKEAQVESKRSNGANGNGARLQGDEEELYRRHAAQLVRVVQGRLGVAPEVAEDACSIAWMQLVRTQPPRDNVMGWLYTVAKYEVYSAYRKQQREQPAEDLPPVVGARPPEEEVEAKDKLRLVRKLKPQQRLALLMKAEGFKYDEICRLTGKTYTWVNRHITEGRQAARRLAAGE
jgi:RNA polymerase sigma factor (sigma-70 family)